MPTLNQMPKHTARLSKTAHDLSQSLAFTAAPGMLLPVYKDILVGGDKIDFTPSIFSRLTPLIAPALCDIEVYLDTFFVPMDMLYSFFGNQLFQVREYFSSQFDDSINNGFREDFPLFNLNDFNFGGIWSQDPSDANNLDRWGNKASDLPNDGVNFENFGSSRFRLFDMLGLNPWSLYGEGFQGATPFNLGANPRIFPWQLLAYQCIYQFYYRMDDWEQFSASAFNIDLTLTAESTESFHHCRSQWSELRYRPFLKDYFTSLKRNPLVAGENLLPLRDDHGNFSEGQTPFSIESIHSFLGGDSYNVLTPDNNGVDSIKNGGTQVDAAERGDSYITTSNIRASFALEKLMRITGRAGKNYDSQMLAHFGVKVPHDVKHQISHLGTSKGKFSLGEVTSMASTENAELGDFAGRGSVAFRGSNIKFTAPCHGVLMCLFSAVPKVRYVGTFDKENALVNRYDLPTPEFMDLGMQPLWAFEAQSGILQEVSGSGDDPSEGAYFRGGDWRLGWQFNYEQYKRKFDRVSEAFRNPSDGFNRNVDNAYKNWVMGKLPFNSLPTITGSSQRSDSYQNYFNLSVYNFLCPPTILNQLLQVPYSVEWSNEYFTKPWLLYQKDPFVCDFHADCTKLSFLSRYGEPQL